MWQFLIIEKNLLYAFIISWSICSLLSIYISYKRDKYFPLDGLWVSLGGPLTLAMLLLKWDKRKC